MRSTTHATSVVAALSIGMAASVALASVARSQPPTSVHDSTIRGAQSENDALTVSPNNTGANSLTKTGTGTLNVNSNNTYTGTTTVNTGTLNTTPSNAGGYGIGGTAGYGITGNGSTGGNDGNGIVKTGTGDVVLPSNTYTGSTSLNGGSLNVNPGNGTVGGNASAGGSGSNSNPNATVPCSNGKVPTAAAVCPPPKPKKN